MNWQAGVEMCQAQDIFLTFENPTNGSKDTVCFYIFWILYAKSMHAYESYKTKIIYTEKNTENVWAKLIHTKSVAKVFGISHHHHQPTKHHANI